MYPGSRRLAAIMFTDMVGYTALGQRNEALSLALVEEQRRIIRPILARHDGREVKTIGDAFLVEFPNAVEAVRCAYDIQRSIREFNLTLSPDKRIHLRIGVHLGEVQESQGDISGDAVNVASRIEPLAEDGGLCISQQVYDHVHNKVDLHFSSMGLRALKNVESSVEVYKMEMPWEERGEHGLNAPKERIAVLPFVSMSPDPNDEFFADGLTEELIGKISQIGGLEVIARTSVMSFKKKDKLVSEIARQLRVGTVVEGSVRKAGNRVRVTVQVIDAGTEAHLFSNNYDSNLDDIFAVQSDVAAKVAGVIPGTVMNPRGSKHPDRDTKDSVAYTSFLQGMQLVYEEEEEPLRQALKWFEESAARDPGFAKAYAAIAKCYNHLANGGYVLWREGIDKGKVAALKALEIDPDLADGHCQLACLLFMADERDSVKAELHRALQLNPNLAEAEYFLAQVAAGAGETEEMLKAIERGYQLDPLSPDIIRAYGIFCFYGGRTEQALDHWKRTLHMNPFGTYRVMFDYYVSRGDYEQAEKTVKEMERIGPTLEYTYLNRGYLAAVTGDEKTAHDMISRLDSAHSPGWVRSASAGFIYLGLGDLDKFFEYMFRAVADDTLPAAMLRYNPIVTRARSDPRFAEIFQRAGIPYRAPG